MLSVISDTGSRCSAIVLAGGRGTRMGGDVSKQFLSLGGYPVLYHSLAAFEECPYIQEIILVAARGQEQYCRTQIVGKYGIRKVSRIVPGGDERYDSVYAGLLACTDPDYVFIHDSARPFLDRQILDRCMEGVRKWGACSAGMPAKDTVCLTGTDAGVLDIPDRSGVWIVQTPQVFSYPLILRAHRMLRDLNRTGGITDDVMVVRRFTVHPVHMVLGAYSNIKITTPEDLPMAEAVWEAQHPEKSEVRLPGTGRVRTGKKRRGTYGANRK